MARAKHWDTMYQKPLDAIPWEIETPPAELVNFLRQHRLKKGSRILDMGCGSGNYSAHLAKRGFRVTGVDYSEKALEIARTRATRAKVRVRFTQGDATKINDLFRTKFDLIFDYSLLHHIAPNKVAGYARHEVELLTRGGFLLLVCYSEKDAAGRSRATGKYGNEMYYRTADEIRTYYRELTEIAYQEARLGKRLHHVGHCFLFKKI